jgi:hypothetical protein
MTYRWSFFWVIWRRDRESPPRSHGPIAPACSVCFRVRLYPMNQPRSRGALAAAKKIRRRGR